MLPIIAIVYDNAQQPDSAIAAYTRYVESTSIMGRFGNDGFFLAGSYKRLGELWEAKGDQEKATRYYTKFVELWKDADPELQPKVSEVRKRLARLERYRSQPLRRISLSSLWDLYPRLSWQNNSFFLRHLSAPQTSLGGGEKTTGARVFAS